MIINKLQTTFLCCCQVPTYLLTPLYKGVKTYQLENTLQLIYKQYKNPQRIQIQKLDSQQFKVHTVLLFCFHCYLEFLSKAHILEIL